MWRFLLPVLLLFALPAMGQSVLSAQDGAGWCAAGKTQANGPAHFAGKRTSAASPNFDATYYHLNLDLRFAPDYLYGRTRIQGRAVDRALDNLALDFASTMQVDSARTDGGTPLAFTHADDVLTLTLPAPIAPNETVAVDVFYQGLPVRDALGTFVMGTRENGDPYAWTLSEPYGARAWWPCKDHPSDKADSVRVTVTLPEGLRAGSNGLLTAEVLGGDGTVTYDWHSHYPISTYLVSFAAGRYDVYHQTYTRPDSLVADFGPLSLPILHYAYRGTSVFDGTYEASGWKRVLDVLPLLEYWFGPYPFPEEKYGHAHFTFGGGMEHQTMSSMGGADLGLVTHELGHMWFGDLITLHTWPELWLNESFATLAELLYWQARAARYPGIYESIFNLYYNRALTAQGTILVQDTTSVANLFTHARVYSKGGMVLHMLRALVGDDTFRQILRTYTADPAVRYGTATTADFERIAEAVSGRDLTTFFAQWVTLGTGYPVYHVNWGYRPANRGYEITVEVTQEQDLPLSNTLVFEMPVTLAVQTASGEIRFTVFNNTRQQVFMLQMDQEPTALRFDPDRQILRSPTVQTVARTAEPVLPEAFRLTAAYPNPASSTLTVETEQAAPEHVQLRLYDTLGRPVRTLLDRTLPAGPHRQSFDLTGLAPGPYFLTLTNGRRTDTRAVVLVPPATDL